MWRDRKQERIPIDHAYPILGNEHKRNLLNNKTDEEEHILIVKNLLMISFSQKSFCFISTTWESRSPSWRFCTTWTVYGNNSCY
jgi:hypothetical protein